MKPWSPAMKYKLQDLIDIEQFQYLQDRLNAIYSFPSAIIDNDGNILTATAWQDVCTKFHRQNKNSETDCLVSDQYILSHLHEANPAVSYRCPRGLVDNATPIIIEGVHYGNFFTGQFFLEPPDLEFFRKQARQFGFDEAAYIEAVKKVPIWSQDQLDHYLFFIKGLIEVISASGLKKLQEIEARKKIEESEQRADTILQKMLDGFWVTDTHNGRILDVNPAMCQLLGYSRDELLGMSVADVEANDSSEDVARRIRQIITEGSVFFQSRMRRKDGSVVDVDVSVTHLPERNLFFGFHRNVTERVQAEEEIRQLNANLEQRVEERTHELREAQEQLIRQEKLTVLGRVAGSMGHELRNPLGVISNAVYFLKMIQPDAGDKVKEYLNLIEKETRISAMIVADLLDFTRTESAQRESVSVSSLIHQALDRFPAPQKVQVELDLPGEELPAFVDPQQIIQVLGNLVLNAYHAMNLKEDGKLVISSQVQNGMICIAVQDSGVGISPENMEKLFEPLFTTKTKGIGLGLAVSKKLIEANGGRIEVESEVGVGSKFILYIPM
jgi:PAS domain S-box-containing protein